MRRSFLLRRLDTEISNLWTVWQFVSLLRPSPSWSHTGSAGDSDSPGVPDSLLLTKAVGGPGPAASLPCLSSYVALLVQRYWEEVEGSM